MVGEEFYFYVKLYSIFVGASSSVSYPTMVFSFSSRKYIEDAVTRQDWLDLGR
jgi:hypothetical protein